MKHQMTVKVAGGRSIEVTGEEVEHPWGSKYESAEPYIDWNFEPLRTELDRIAKLDREGLLYAAAE